MQLADSGSLEVLLLGPLEVRRDGEPLPLGGARPRALLANLALHAGEVLSVDRIVDDLWGEQPPASAAHGVEVYVSQLRKHLGSALVTRTPGYALEVPGERVDATRFAAHAADGRSLLAHDPLSAGATLREALSLWRGSALADFTFEPFAQISIARLEELRLECIEDRVEADLAAGRHVDLVPELEALVRAEPRRERLREQLMLALYRCGRAPDALAVYRDTRELLVEELGMEPGPGLRSLEGAILRQDDSLVAPVAPTETPRTVRRRLAAVVAADLVDTGDPRDPEMLLELLTSWRELAATVVGRHGGSVETSASDSMLAVFGVPLAREDDLVRAARAAVELRTAVESLDGVRVKIGVETGEVASGDSLLAGPALNLARAAARAAEPGEVVAGERAAALLAHAARFAPGTARLLEVAEDAPAFRRRLDTQLVGREHELHALREVFAEVSERGACRAVRLVGPAGIGKSRLARELADGLQEEAFVLVGACTPEAAGSTYRPLERIVRKAEGSTEGDPILAAALGIDGGTPSAAEVAWAFRRLCERLAAKRPVLLVLDDVHWAEPTLLDLLEQLAARGRGPILLLCLAREELAEEHPSFLEGAEHIVLDALSPEETSALVARLLGGRPFPEELLDRVTGAAEGNPLYLEQLLAFVSEEGIVSGRPLPPTIQSLLAARLDRLGPGERTILTRAAIVGREFGGGELAALLEPDAAPTVARHLRTLAERGFVRGADDAFRFRHVLLQEAAYRAISKAERADLHERLADHLGRTAAPDELVGFHLERACGFHEELGSDERRLRQLAADAGARLGAAGILAWKRNDVAATVRLLERATVLLPADSPLARELMCELGLALRAGGDAARAQELLAEVSGDSSSIGLRARIELEFVRLLEEPGATAQELLDLAESIVPAFEALYDDRALGRAWLLTAFVQGGRYLRCKAWQEAAERALFHYRRAGWPPASCLAQLSGALYVGPTSAEDAAMRCEALLRETGLGPAGEANVRVFLGGLLAMLGRLEDGRTLVRSARRTFEELGQAGFSAAVCGEVAGGIESLAGDFAAAERVLRESCDVLQRASLMSTFSTAAGALAAAIYAQGRFAEAEEWSHRAEEAAGADDLDARLVWQPVRAKVLARRSEHDLAEVLARDAASAALATDALNRRARVLLDLAEVLRLGGNDVEASSFVERARRDFEAKGNVAAAGHIGSPTTA